VARETDVADQGQFENGTKVQGVHEKTPGFGTPLDPLSRSFMKTKKDKKRYYPKGISCFPLQE